MDDEMDAFFRNLNDVGFISAAKVAPLTLTSSEGDAQQTILKSLPKAYLEVLSNFTLDKRKRILLKVASSIDLYIRTKYTDTDVYVQWSKSGVLPHHYHEGLNTRSIASLAKNILRIRNKITKDGERVNDLESLDKPTKSQTQSLEKAHDRYDKNTRKLAELEENFYFEFRDFESSIGGAY